MLTRIVLLTVIILFNITVKVDCFVLTERNQHLSPSAMYMHILRSAHRIPTSKALDKEFMATFKSISLESLLRDAFMNRSSNCSRDMAEIYNASTTEMWALKYIDSSATRPSGFLRGDLRWLGDFDQCLGIGTVVTNSSATSISPKFCRLSFTARDVPNPPERVVTFITYGFTICLCVSSTCEIDTITDVINPKFEPLPIWINPHQSHCIEENVPFNGLAIFTIIVFSIVAVFLLMGLVVDLSIQLGAWLRELRKKSSEYEPLLVAFDKDEESASLHKSVSEDWRVLPPQIPGSKLDRFVKVAMCFSPYENFTRLITFPKQGQNEESTPNLTAFNGIRVLSLFWVILGHSYFFLLFLYDNLVEASDFLTRTSYMFVQAGYFAVDTFLFLSGFFAYWSMAKQIKPVRSFWVKQLPFIYLHRWVRLIGPYLAIILIDLGLWAHFSSGPFYFQDIDPSCAYNGWTNLLYINNLVHAENQCVSWSWYLAVDMQLFLIAPFIVFLFNWRPRYGWLACMFALFAQVVIATSLTFAYNLPMVLTAPMTNASLAKNYDNYFEIFYVKPYTRFAPHIIGIMCAHLALKHAFDLSRRIFSQLWLSALMWLLMFGIMLTLTYAPSSIYGGDYVEPQIADAFFNSFARMAWSLALGWLVLACAFNQAGPIGAFLSWPYWSIPARLSYSAYLIHPLILIFYGQTSRRPYHSTDLNNIFIFLATTLASILLAIPHSLAFESPIARLQQLLIKGKSKK